MNGFLHNNSSKSIPCIVKIQNFDLSNNCCTGSLPMTYTNNFRAIINLSKDASMGVQDIDGGGGFYSYSIGNVMKGQNMGLS